MSEIPEDIFSTDQLGNYLKKHREERGITLEQIHNTTKIRKRYIEALEAGDFTQIPGGEVYVKGFLRNYSQAVGLDAEKILDIYKGLRKEYSQDSTPEKIPLWEENESKSITMKVKPSIATLLLILIAFTLSFILIRGAFTPNATPPERDLETPGENLEPPAIIDEHLEEREPEDYPQTVEEKVPLVVLAHEDPRKSLYLVEDDEDLMVTLEVLKNSRCWISAEVDGQKEYEATLTSGEKQTFVAKDNITIRVGNPQVVKLTINHQDMGVPGGAARDIVIERNY